MATLCDTTCGAVSAPPSAYDAACTTETRIFGAEYFVLAKCDVLIDMEDGGVAAGDGSATAYNVAGAVASGDLVTSPRGKLIKGTTDQELIEDAFGCGEDIIGVLETNYDFTTYRTSGCDGIDDYTYWADIFDNYAAYRIMVVDCCGFITYDSTNNATASPGFTFSITTFPNFVEGEAGLGLWEFGFSVTHTKSLDIYYDATQTPLIMGHLGISI